MNSQNPYLAQSNKDELFKELGIQNPSNIPSFDPNNQEITISMEDTGIQKFKKQDKYADDDGFDDQQQFIGQQSRQKASVQINDPLQNLPSATQKQNQSPKLKTTKNKNRKLVRARRNGRPNREKQKKQIRNQSLQIGMNQVAEWAEKGTKVKNKQDQNSSQSDFDEEGPTSSQTKQQIQIKKRIQQKLKKYENPNAVPKSSGGSLNSLKNKAQEIKRKKQQKLIQNDETYHQLNKNKFTQQIKEEEDQDQNQDCRPQASKSHQINNKQQVMQAQESQDDPWDKINEQTIAAKNNKTQINNNMNNDPYFLIDYYRKYPIEDIDSQQAEQPATGFFQQLCACLNPSKPKKNQAAKRIITISKLPLTNSMEQMTLLKQIWVRITNKPFQRYGEHWNEIGFQGRDPSTDIRSAGVLSLVNWFSFILKFHQYSLQLHNFCVQFDIPLALTHIKITSLLVSCIKKGVLGGRRWQDYEEWYNCFIFYTFDYIMKNGKNLEQLGDFVEKAVERTKKNTEKAKSQYLSKKKK